MAYFKLNFESQYLHGNTEVGVILPNPHPGLPLDACYDSNARYKVLWLLHGTTGDFSDWSRWSMLEVYANENDLAVVMPSTHNASYTNWPGFGGGYDVYDYIIKELMPMVYNWFPVSDKREDNFIAGLSMGALGALKFALTDPEKFAGAAMLSSCPHHYEYELTTPKGAANHRYKNLFANAGGYEAFLASDDNCWRMFDEMIENADLPMLYFVEGEDDEFFDFFSHFMEHVKERGFNVRIETIPGYTHEWRVWDLTLQRALKLFGFRVREDAVTGQ